MAEKDYLVISPIKHGGKRIEIGGTVTMDEELAAPFLGGVLQGKPAIVVHAAPTGETERIAGIREAILKLDPNDAGLWMKNGAPKTEAIQVHTQWPVKANERDAVWAEIKGKAE